MERWRQRNTRRKGGLGKMHQVGDEDGKRGKVGTGKKERLRRT